MHQPKPKKFVNLVSINILVLNVRYMCKTYFLTHVFFTAPYIIMVIGFDVERVVREVAAYTCIIAWFAYGMHQTKQPKFVAVIGVLFIASQWAYFSDYGMLDILLTSVCVLLMCIKQYVRRFYFAILVAIYDEENKRRKAQ